MHRAQNGTIVILEKRQNKAHVTNSEDKESEEAAKENESSW